MFNSPALDIAIGLVFIFLLYSLLATSIQEAIATLFSLRASMLRKSIVENMLADTPLTGRLASFRNAVIKSFRQLMGNLRLMKKLPRTSLGWRFYDHPLIKNYGESKMFPLPSYIPKDNFSAVLVDILLKDFRDALPDIARHKADQNAALSVPEAETLLASLPDTHKIRETLRYRIHRFESDAAHVYYIPCDTCRILEMHLRNSQYELEAFCDKLESWFDDSMHRVSGWYKRQTQFILFCIGLVLAVIFNVDTIDIAGRLSTDKDARDKLVEMAVRASESYKDDPRVRQLNAKDSLTAADMNDLKAIRARYDRHVREARKTLDGDISEANNLLSVGWDGYGQFDPVYVDKIKSDSIWWGVNFCSAWTRSQQHDTLRTALTKLATDAKIAADSLTLTAFPPAKGDTIENRSEAMASQMDQKALREVDRVEKRTARKADSLSNAAFFDELRQSHPVAMRARYMAYSIDGKKILGFLILGFGICLGAPFWFDLLNKLVSLRGSGKKEAATGTQKISPAGTSSPQPVSITVHNQQNGEEAVG